MESQSRSWTLILTQLSIEFVFHLSKSECFILNGQDERFISCSRLVGHSQSCITQLHFNGLIKGRIQLCNMWTSLERLVTIGAFSVLIYKLHFKTNYDSIKIISRT